MDKYGRLTKPVSEDSMVDDYQNQALWDDLWKNEGSGFSLKKDPAFYALERNVVFKENMRVLEAGCGTGLRTLTMFNETSADLTFLDFSKIGLDLLRKRLGLIKRKARLVRADVLNMPFEDNSFDFVWNQAVVEHFSGKDRQKVFDEMFRVTKKGGRCFVLVPNSWNLFYHLWKFLRKVKGRWRYGFEKPFSPIELKRRMEKAGFENIKRDGEFFLYSFAGFCIPPQIQSFLRKLGSKKPVSGGFGSFFSKRLHDLYRRDFLLNGFLGKEIGVLGLKV